MRKYIAFFLLLFFAFVSHAAIDQKVAGKVKRIKGSALAVQDAEVRPLKVGDEVLIGDILSTGSDSRLEISMIDEGSFKLGARTSFVVIDYTFGQGNNNAILELLNGVMDGVSGEIAKASPDGMKVLTRHASIGIRGTTFFVGELEDKIHVAHWSGGGLHIKNHGGEVFIKEENHGTILHHDHKAPSKPEKWHGDKKKHVKSLVHHK